MDGQAMEFWAGGGGEGAQVDMLIQRVLDILRHLLRFKIPKFRLVYGAKLNTKNLFFIDVFIGR